MKGMKNKSIILTCILTAILVTALMPAASFAASKENYKYTVRVYAGEQGTVDGEDYIEETFDSDGTQRFTFDYNNRAAVKPGSKYYVKGIKLAGRDTEETLEGTIPSFVVTEDTDLVIAYGIKGSMVKYTIKYVDAANGKELLKSEEFYVNDGDKPVVAYKYIENYRPRYYNITGTVKKGKDNTWTFKYDYMKEDDSATESVAAVNDVKKNHRSDWFGFMITAHADSGEGELAEDADFSQEPIELYDLDEEEASESISGEVTGNPKEEVEEDTEESGEKAEPEESAPKKGFSTGKIVLIAGVVLCVLLILLLVLLPSKKKN